MKSVFYNERLERVETKSFVQYIANPEYRNLPAGYTQVKYLESSGTQYIDTGVIPAVDDEIILDAQLTSTTNGKQLFGNNYEITRQITTYQNKIYLQNFNVDEIEGACIIDTDTNRHIYKIKNGDNSIDLVTGTTSATKTSVYSYFLFSRQCIERNPASMMCYSFEIKNRIDLVPCYNSNNVAGMYDLVNNVFYQNAGTGTFIVGDPVPPLVRVEEKDFVLYDNRALCFTATQDNSSVGYSITGTVDTSGIQYSRNMGRTWTNWNGTAISLNNGQKMYVRNTNNTLSTNSGNYFKFTMTGKIEASGNCNSMINFSELTGYCYTNMFYNCRSLTTPPQLPATTLANYCYTYMFGFCSSLTTAPELPATTLANNCYTYMFGFCNSLTTPPQLPATTIATNCYNGMFGGCKRLTKVPKLRAKQLYASCYASMFSGCISLQVNDTQTEQAPYEWSIPTNDTFANDITLTNVFTNCLGTRASNDLVATTGSYKVYYTQYQPI